MPFNSNTSAPFPNITVDSEAGTLTFQLSDFTQPLKPEEVDPLAGTSDWRELVFSFLDHISIYFNTLEADDRPLNLTINKNGRLDSDNNMVYTYSVNIVTHVSEQDVAPEPVP